MSLRFNFSWVLAGSVIYNASQFGIFVVLTKYFDLASVGTYTFALAVVTPVVMFCNLQLRGVLATDVKGTYDFSTYVTLRTVSNLTVLAFLAILSVFLNQDVSTLVVLWIIAISKIVESQSDIIFGYFQNCEHMAYIGKSYILKGLGGLFCVFVTAYFTQNLIAVSCSLALWWTLLLIVYDIRNVKKFSEYKLGFNLDNLVKLAWVGLPLGIVMGLLTLKNNVPKYFVENYLGKSSLGIFGPLSYIIVGLNQVITAMGHASIPRLARYYISNRASYGRLLRKLLFVSVGLGGVFILFGGVFGKPFLQLVYTNEHAGQYSVFLWLMVVCMLNLVVSVFGYAMTAARYFKSQVPLFLGVLVVSAIASFHFIPKYGLQGAAIAMLSGALAQMVGSILIVWHSLRRKPS